MPEGTPGKDGNGTRRVAHTLATTLREDAGKLASSIFACAKQPPHNNPRQHDCAPERQLYIKNASFRWTPTPPHYSQSPLIHTQLPTGWSAYCRPRVIHKYLYVKSTSPACCCGCGCFLPSGYTLCSRTLHAESTSRRVAGLSIGT